MADNGGKLVIGDIQHLMYMYMQKTIFLNWQIEVPNTEKQVVIDIIHSRYIYIIVFLALCIR